MGNRKHKGRKLLLFFLLLAVIIAAVRKTGILGGTGTKVLKAAVHTFDQWQMAAELDTSAYTSDRDYHALASFHAGGKALDLRYDVSGGISQLSFEKDLSQILIPVNLSVIAQVEDQTVKVQIPSIGNNVYVYEHYDNSILAFMQEPGTLQLNLRAKAKILEAFGRAKFKKADHKKLALKGKETKCTGYETAVSGENIKALYQDIMETYSDEEKNLFGTLHGNDAEAKLYEILEHMGDGKVTVYLADNTITDILLSSEKSKDVIEITMDLLADTEKVDITVNSSLFLNLSYDTAGKEAFIAFGGEKNRVLKFSVNETENEKVFEIQGLDSVSCLVGNLGESGLSGKSNVLVHALAGSILDKVDLGLTLRIGDGAEIQELTGDQIHGGGKGVLTILEVLADVLETAGVG